MNDVNVLTREACFFNIKKFLVVSVYIMFRNISQILRTFFGHFLEKHRSFSRYFRQSFLHHIVKVENFVLYKSARYLLSVPFVQAVFMVVSN